MMNGAMEWCGNIIKGTQLIYVCESIIMIHLPTWQGGQNVGFYHNFDVADCPQS
jgi:hypothetical protein